MTSKLTNIIRHLSVEGYNGMKNDAIFVGENIKADRNVIFFGGDVQDFKELMESHRDNVRYSSWDLETSGRLIWERCSSETKPAHIWVIRPSRKLLGTFSFYDNFVFTEDSDGSIPKFIPVEDQETPYQAMKHTQSLLVSLCELQNKHFLIKDPQDAVCSPTLPLSLIGFSKGCVVLNQLFLEISRWRPDQCTLGNSLRSLYWLDSGHRGDTFLWPTSEQLLSDVFVTGPLANKFNAYFYATPYQVTDPSRPWNGREFKKLISTLKGLKAQNWDSHVYASDQEKSLEIHFSILKLFDFHDL